MAVGWLACIAAASSVNSQGPAAQSTDRTPLPVRETNAPIKSVGAGVYELGAVRLDKVQKSISFPAAINMNEGLIEYWLVSSGGKLHESLLRTEVEPYQIHLAMLLVGAQAGATNLPAPNREAKPSSPQPTFFSKTNLPANLNTSKLVGDRVSLSMSWNGSGREKSCQADETVLNQQTKALMSRGDWVYNGSRVIEGNFIAQRDRSIVSIISDPDALINNPRPGRETDEIWQVNSTNVPPVGTVVQVTIKMENSAGKL